MTAERRGPGLLWNYQGSPCKDCPDRYPACSSACDRYKEWRRGYDEFRAADRKEQQAWIDASCVRFGKKPRRKKPKE